MFHIKFYGKGEEVATRVWILCELLLTAHVLQVDLGVYNGNLKKLLGVPAILLVSKAISLQLLHLNLPKENSKSRPKMQKK